MTDEFDKNIGEEADFDDEGVIVFRNEEGEEVEFIEIAYFDYKDKFYSALTPIEEDENGEEEGTPLYFAEVIENDDGEEFRMIEDESLSDELFAEFQKLEVEEE